MKSLGWIWRDLVHAVRSLRRDAGSVVLALLALSLGIGAATVIFSVVYSVLISAFPFDDPSRVVHFYVQTPEGVGQSAWYPAPDFAYFRERNEVFSDVLGGASFEALYSLDNSTYRVRGALLDPRSLDALGVRPILGRPMTDADGAPDAPPTFLMSDRMWSERFNRDPGVLGMSLEVNGIERTLLAVLPPRFLLHGADIFFPTAMTADLTDAVIGGTGSRPLSIWTYARLKPGVTPEQAAAHLELLARNRAEVPPERYPPQFRIAVVSLRDAYTAASLKELVYILVGAVMMLLLIACGNVGNLLLVRATARETELALRSSLGASRARLMFLPLAESLLLSATGATVGGMLAYLGIRWVRTAVPAEALPAEMDIRFSGYALLVAIAVTMLTALACGLVPAFRSARGDLQGRLAGTGKGVGNRSGRGRLRQLLIAVQVTLAIVLLVGAGLMMRTLVVLQSIDPGLQTQNVLVGSFGFPQNARPTQTEMSIFVREVMARIAALPEVVAVSPTYGVPLEGGPGAQVNIPGAPPADEPAYSMMEWIGEGYFRATGIPLVRGRTLTAADVDGQHDVAVVNRRFVEEFLGGADPIGRTFTLASGRPDDPSRERPWEIVGVVGDTRNGGLQSEVIPQAFLPYTRAPIVPDGLVMRTTVDPRMIEPELRQQVWAVNPTVALMNTMSLDEILNRNALGAPKFGFGLLSTFAVIGLVLSAIGVFSVIAYTVSLQTHEIGIRLALGVEPRAMVRTIVRRGVGPILVGVLAGLAASYALSRLMVNQIYGVSATDPWTFAGMALILIAIGTIACLIPARRAARVDPLIALRHE